MGGNNNNNNSNNNALSERSCDVSEAAFDVEAYLYQEYPYGLAQRPWLGLAQGPGLAPGSVPLTPLFDPNRIVAQHDRSTLLMFAANENNVELIRELVRRGENIEVRLDTTPFPTPFHAMSISLSSPASRTRYLTPYANPR